MSGKLPWISVLRQYPVQANGTANLRPHRAIMHDPQEYPDPFVFNPERFLPSKTGSPMQPDPRSYAFGFGRRRCPGTFSPPQQNDQLAMLSSLGIQFAETSMLLIMSSILANFTIICPAHCYKEGTARLEFTTGITRCAMAGFRKR